MKKYGILLFSGLMLFQACNLFKKKHNPDQGDEASAITAEAEPAGNNSPAECYVPYAEYRAAATQRFDLVHTRLQVEPDFATKTMPGTAWITLKPHFYPDSVLELDARYFIIRGVSEVTAENAVKPLEYNYSDSEVLRISLGRLLSRSQQITVKIDYVAQPEHIPAGGSAAITRDKGLYFINADRKDPEMPVQLWTQGETQSSSCWFPTIDRPNQKTTQEMAITVADTFKTLSNGLLIRSEKNGSKRTDFWKMDLPHAPYLFMMAAGDWHEEKDLWNGKPVNYYLEHKYAAQAKLIFGNTPEMISLFSRLTGVEYPWPKYHQVVVREFVSGAMENTTATVHFEGLQHDARTHLDEPHEDIIAHELFHQWFGDLVTCESWANLPLNESFATYGEYLWIEHKYGRDDADDHLESDRRDFLSEASDNAKTLFRPNYKQREDMFDGHSYQKGGTVLHMLRKYLGDEAFFASLKEYLTSHKFGTAEINDLRMACEKVSGEDLNWFFNQWFMSAQYPKLDVTPLISDKKLTLYTVQKQERPFVLPLKITIFFTDKKISKSIKIDDINNEFSFDFDEKPIWVLFDEENALTGEISISQSLAAWELQLKNAPLAEHRRRALKELSERDLSDEKMAAIMATGISDVSWVVRAEALKHLEDLSDPASATVEMLSAKIENLAASDPKSAVRSSAFRVLANRRWNASPDVLLAGLDDQSYIVNSSALSALDGKAIPREKLENLLNAEDQGLFSTALGKVMELNPADPMAELKAALTRSALPASFKASAVAGQLFQADRITQYALLGFLEKEYISPDPASAAAKLATQYLGYFHSSLQYQNYYIEQYIKEQPKSKQEEYQKLLDQNNQLMAEVQRIIGED